MDFFFFFYNRSALPWIYQSNHVKILPLIYIVKKKGNWIIMKNIHDQVWFFLHPHLHHLLRRKTKSSNISCRHQIKYDVCNITLHGVSFLLLCEKYNIYIIWHLSIVSWHRVMVYTPEFKYFWNEKKIADECLHPRKCQILRELNVLLLFHF